jgi:hypothetical protein
VEGGWKEQETAKEGKVYELGGGRAGAGTSCLRLSAHSTNVET